MSFAHLERDPSMLSRDILESLPQSLYGKLPWPSHTISSCIEVVLEAERMNNPRRVRLWIENARSVSNDAELLGCLDGVLRQMTRPGVGFSDRDRLAKTIRQDAIDYLKDRETAHAGAPDARATAMTDGLVAGLRLHDELQADHAEETAVLARRLAHAAGVPPPAAGRTFLAARLHDVGKARIRAALFARALPLDAADMAELRTYPQAGADILRSLPELSFLAPLVAAHRERVDGSGYPQGLRGDDIPLESRIVSIADVFHTLTLRRPYRPAFSVREALEEVMRGAGTQFDAELVATFARIVGYRGSTRRPA